MDLKKKNKRKEERKKQLKDDQKNIKREMERIEIRQKEKANEESTGMENEENKEGKEKKERSGYSLGGLAAFLVIMPSK